MKKAALPEALSGEQGHDASAPDPRNALNDLTNREWMVETKSVWFSRPPQRDDLKAQHPATFAETDIIRLIEFFTKPGMKVLDPFLGTGSTLVACSQCGRLGIGIELIDQWADVARQRIEVCQTDTRQGNASAIAIQQVLVGDCRELMAGFADDSFDFIVTSPPYWSILRKDWDHKVKAERKSKGLQTRYSDRPDDLGNVPSYEAFLAELGKIFAECMRVLKPKRYMCVVVSDFRHGSDFIAYHSDVSRVMQAAGFTQEGITILVQDSKNLYPYGIPFAFVSNIHHQYILTFRKNGERM